MKAQPAFVVQRMKRPYIISYAARAILNKELTSLAEYLKLYALTFRFYRRTTLIIFSSMAVMCMILYRTN